MDLSGHAGTAAGPGQVRMLVEQLARHNPRWGYRRQRHRYHRSD
jgi:hypothetical protein